MRHKANKLARAFHLAFSLLADESARVPLRASAYASCYRGGQSSAATSEGWLIFWPTPNPPGFLIAVGRIEIHPAPLRFKRALLRSLRNKLQTTLRFHSGPCGLEHKHSAELSTSAIRKMAASALCFLERPLETANCGQRRRETTPLFSCSFSISSFPATVMPAAMQDWSATQACAKVQHKRIVDVCFCGGVDTR